MKSEPRIYDPAALPNHTSANPSRDEFFRPSPAEDGQLSLGSVLDHARALVVVSRDAMAVFDEEAEDAQIRSRAVRRVLNDALEQLDEAMIALEGAADGVSILEWQPSNGELPEFLRKGGAR